MCQQRLRNNLEPPQFSALLLVIMYANRWLRRQMH